MSIIKKKRRRKRRRKQKPVSIIKDVKMFFAVRKDLKMGKGKMAAQVGHCTLALYKQLIGNKKYKTMLEDWENRGSKKVVAKVKNEKEMMNLRKQAQIHGVMYSIICDAGKTQIEAGSQTVIGFIGYENKIKQFTGNLKLM